MNYSEVTFTSHLLFKTTLVIVCIVLALVFVRIPLPTSVKLKNYRLSLKILTGAYLMIASVFLASMLINIYEGLFSFIVIITAAIQSFLFTLLLIILYNPNYVIKKFVYKHSLPFVVLIVLYIYYSVLYGSVYLYNLDDYYRNFFHPKVIIRSVAMVFYAFELIYFSRIVLNQEQIYKQKLDTYFADNLRLQLVWVRYYFFIALIIGVLVLISCFYSNHVALTVFRAFYILFFIIFGLRFIQYKHIYYHVEPALNDTEIEKFDSTTNYQWTTMKDKILNEKYYLKENVTIEEMASRLKVGRTKLSTCINKEENMHFNLWINSLRIQDAKSLFKKQQELSILQVSEMVGYSEQSNFSKQFKKITGKSPSVWRKEENEA